MNAEEKTRALVSLSACYQRSVALFDCFRPYINRWISGESLSSDENRRATALCSYWFGSLYVIVEGWEELGFRNAAIDNLLADSRVDTLRRFRNFIFHYQRDWDDKRVQALVDEGHAAIPWILVLATKLDEILLPHYEGPRADLFFRWVMLDDPNMPPESA